MRYKELKETASGGATAAGSIASVANPLGSLSRRPSIFGYVETKPKTKKKKKKTKESSLSEAKNPWLRITPRMLQQAKGNKCQVIVEIPIVDFLKLTTRTDEQIEQIKKEAKNIRQYNKWAKMADNSEFDAFVNRNREEREYGTIIMPFLDINVEKKTVIGHEGRHRAAAALASNNSTIPVALCLRGNFHSNPDRRI